VKVYILLVGRSDLNTSAWSQNERMSQAMVFNADNALRTPQWGSGGKTHAAKIVTHVECDELSRQCLEPVDDK
jgi:hypothetical protein